MKILERLTLKLYSWIILIISILSCFLVFKWIKINDAQNLIYKLIIGETSSKIILGISIIFILLSIKCIFFSKKGQMKESQGVLLQNENGKLMISKNTIENLVNSAVKEFKDTQEVITNIELDKDNNVNVFVNLKVADDAVIKDLSVNLQNTIKEKVKAATDLEVKEINIKIQDVNSEQENKQ